MKTENNMNYKLFVPLVAIVCLLFTACDKGDVLPGEPMLLTHEILTPESVKYEGGSVDWVPKYYFSPVFCYSFAKIYKNKYIPMIIQMQCFC